MRIAHAIDTERETEAGSSSLQSLHDELRVPHQVLARPHPPVKFNREVARRACDGQRSVTQVRK